MPKKMPTKKLIKFTCIRCGLTFESTPSQFKSHNKKGLCDICNYADEQSNKGSILKWM